MALFQPEDFSNNFHSDFHQNDVFMVIDRLNASIDQFRRDWGEPFIVISENIAENHNGLRHQLADKIAAILHEVVVKRRSYLDQNLNDVIDAVILSEAKIAMDSRNDLGGQQTYDWVNDQLRRNPFMQSSGGRRDYNDNRNNGNQRNYNERNSNNNAGNTRYAQNSGQQARRDSTPPGRGRLVSDKDRQSTQQNEPREQRQDQPTPEIKNGEVVTSDNRILTGIDFAPVYIVGDEQTIYMDGKLEVTDYSGTNEVDYEKHRVDLFFPNIIGPTAMAATNSWTETAIRRAEQAMDLKISGFLNDPANPDAPPVADTKLFQTVKSATYGTLQVTFGLELDPIDVRDAIIESHGSTTDWFRDNALIVNVDQVVEFGKGNDALLNAQSVNKATNYLDVVKWLIGLSNFIDASRWKFIHDHITRNLNIIMLRHARLGVKVGSITGDWKELSTFLDGVDQSKRTLMQANFPKLRHNLDIIRDEQDGQNQLRVKHTLVFLPVTSYECELASASTKSGIVTVEKNSKIYNLVSRLYENDPYGDLSFVTLDGLRFGLLMSEQITSREFDIILF